MYMIPFVWNTQGRQANEDNKYISSCLGEQGWGVTDGYVDSFSVAENVLKKCSVIVVMQLCGYNKNHWIVHFMVLNSVMYELYLYLDKRM